MRRPASASLLLVALWLLGAGAAGAQTPRGSGKRRSPQEEKRRKLLEEIGLDKKDAPPPAPAAARPEPAAENKAEDEKAEPAPATSADGDRRGAGKPGPSRSTTATAAPSFRRAIHPLLMATCHSCHRPEGPAAATRLTLAGDAATDHPAVARLVAVRDPAASVLLLKVSGQPHAGGSPWPTGSDAYARVLAWIGKGARLDGAAPVEAAPTPPPPPPPPPRKSAPPPPAPVASVAAPVVPPSTVEAPAVAEAAPASPAPAPRHDFAGVVHPILMAACASCHAPGAPAGMTRLVLSGDAAADQEPARALVDPAAPARSPLVSKASGQLHGGGTVLPAADPRLSTLLAWAAQPDSPAVVTPSASAAPAPPPPPAAPPAGTSRAAPIAARPGEGYRHQGGLELPFGFLLNGRFDLTYERRQFTGNPFDAEGVNALRSYHHFLFLSRARSDDPCGLSVEIVTLQFWEAHCRVLGRSHPVSLVLSGGKILVPFGADPLYHQSYGGLAGFDQRLLPVIWAQEGIAAHLVHQRGDLVLSDDFFAVRGYALPRADAVLNLQSDFSPVDDAEIGWGNRLGAAWRWVSGWYSAYYNPLGFGRHLFMQAVDLTIWRPRSVPVVGHFSLGAGLFRADVAGGGAGGAGQDYYHFGSYLQLRYHPTDWLFLQYRQGLRTFNNRRGVILDNSRLTSADSSTHNFGVVGRYRGLTAGIFYFINLEKVDEIPDDLFRVSIAYEF